MSPCACTEEESEGEQLDRLCCTQSAASHQSQQPDVVWLVQVRQVYLQQRLAADVTTIWS